MNPRQLLKAVAVLAAAFAPLAGDWIYKVWIHPRPYWILYYDPETIYFYTGQELSFGRSPSNIDNPGTPVQLLSMAMIRLLNIGPLQFDEFRLVGYSLAFAANLAVGFLLLAVVFRGLPILLQITGQWLCFLCPQALEYNNVWSPELWYFAAGGLFIAAWAAPGEQPLSGRRLLLAGALLGFCCSIKLTFVAWAPGFVLACFLTRPATLRVRLSATVQGFLGIVAGFVVGTAVIVPRYPELFGWAARLASRSGSYGSGAVEAPSLTLAFSQWQDALLSAKGWCLLIAALAVAVAWHLFREQRAGRPLCPRTVPLVVWAVSSFAFSYLLSSRQVALRYLLPSSYSVIVLFLVAARAKPVLFSRLGQAALFCAAAVLLGKHIQTDVQAHDRRIADGEAIQQQIQSLLAEATPEGKHPIVIYGWRCPSPSFALRIYGTPEAETAIDTRYPREGYFNLMTKRIVLPDEAEHWDFLVVTEDELHEMNIPIGPVLGTAGPFLLIAAPP